MKISENKKSIIIDLDELDNIIKDALYNKTGYKIADIFYNIESTDDDTDIESTYLKDVECDIK